MAWKVRKVQNHRGKQAWLNDVTYRDGSGRRRRYRRVSSVNTRAGALAEEARLRARLQETGTLDLPREDHSTAQHDEALPSTFSDAWEAYRQGRLPKLKPSTAEGYERIVAAGHLDPLMGVLMVDLTGKELSAIDTELASAEKSPSSRRNVQILARSILRHQLGRKHLNSLELPQLPKVGRKLPRPLTREQVNVLLAAAHPTLRLPMALIAFQGLRPNEARALRKKDVEKWQLNVRRSLYKVNIGAEGTRLVARESTPKSHHERAIPMHDVVRELLRTRVAATVDSDEYVCLTQAGESWGNTSLSQAFSRLVGRLRNPDRLKSRVPYGYAMLDGEVKENREEQRVIKTVQRMRARGVIYRKIAEHLLKRDLLGRDGNPFTRAQLRWIVVGRTEVPKPVVNKDDHDMHPDVSLYDLRHFFATELFRKGVPAPVVKELMGHADLATTQRYADFVKRDLQNAIAAIA